MIFTVQTLAPIFTYRADSRRWRLLIQPNLGFKWSQIKASLGDKFRLELESNYSQWKSDLSFQWEPNLGFTGGQI